MQNNSSNQHASPRDLRKDGLWATKLGFYLMWMEYLAISPSYELARRYRMGSLTDEQQQNLPDWHYIAHRLTSERICSTISVGVLTLIQFVFALRA